jgi:hypothetical protein
MRNECENRASFFFWFNGFSGGEWRGEKQANLIIEFVFYYVNMNVISIDPSRS